MSIFIHAHETRLVIRDVIC